MKRASQLAAIGLAAVVLAACSGNGSSTIPSPMHGMGANQMSRNDVPGLDLTKVHVMRPVGFQQGGVSPDNCNPNCAPLSYFGGVVLTKPKIYVVFWGFAKAGDPSGEKTYLTDFYKGVGGSKWESDLTQYYQIVSGVKTHITNPTSELAGSWSDATHAVPSAPTDAQVQAEAALLVAHFGYSKQASYVVATPHNHSTGGFGSSFCAYHGNFSSGGHDVYYTNLPYQSDAGFACGVGFINTPGTEDGVSIVSGHEYAETITDPIPPTAWYNNSYGEIGDECAWVKPPAGNITLTTGKFAVQGLYSNKRTTCSISGP